MKILLIGAKGQVGSEIKDLALIKNLDVISFGVDELNIVDSRLVNKVFIENTGIDVVINAAAYTNLEKSEEDLKFAYAVNCDGVENLAKACRDNNLPLLHISTDYVFDGIKESAYSETDITNPLNNYAKSKLAGEKILAKTWHKHIILRVSWVFGKYRKNFVKTILQLSNHIEELDVVGDQYGCPTASSDVARVLLELAEKICLGKHIWGLYHYCGSPRTDWFSFTKRILDLANDKLNIKVQKLNSITSQQHKSKVVRPKNSELLVKKIIEDYNIKRHDWESYLIKVIKDVVL
jgi:dTDP-4-dehydrorhamnose reductase